MSRVIMRIITDCIYKMEVATTKSPDGSWPSFVNPQPEKCVTKPQKNLKTEGNWMLIS